MGFAMDTGQGAVTSIVDKGIGAWFGNRAANRQAKRSLQNQKDWFGHLRDQGLTPYEIAGASGYPGDGGSASAFGSQADKGQVSAGLVARQQMQNAENIANIQAAPQHEKNQIEARRLDLQGETTLSKDFLKEMKILGMGVQNMIVSSIEAILNQHGISPLQNPEKFDLNKAAKVLTGKKEEIKAVIKEAVEAKTQAQMGNAATPKLIDAWFKSQGWARKILESFKQGASGETRPGRIPVLR